ncbi:hypothetical protein U1Q18_022665 [Sarracenia purpurea var. burkii]
MAVLGHRSVVVAVIVIVGMAISGSKVVFGQCKGDLNGLLSQCGPYMKRQGPTVPPSGACCQVLKTVDVPCVCAHIPKEAEQIISIDQAIHVVQSCGISLHHGMKCGSKKSKPCLG